MALRVIVAMVIALLAVNLSAAHASFAKNGRLLLLTCDPTAEGSQRSSHFRTMRADGRDFRTIAKFNSTSNYCYVDRATWSPDGRTIVYSTGNSIWTMRADGTRHRKLLEEGGYAAWSPNGREIIFTKSVGPGKAAVFRERRDPTSGRGPARRRAARCSPRR